MTASPLCPPTPSEWVREFRTEQLLTPQQLEDLRADAHNANRAGHELELRYDNPRLRVQIESLRMHRWLTIRHPPSETPSAKSDGTTSLIDAFNLTADWRKEPEVLLQELETLSEDARVALFRWVLGAEEDAYGVNRVKPYEDLVPILLTRLSSSAASSILSRLSPGELARVLFGDYTRLASSHVCKLLQAVPPMQVAQMLRASTANRDWVREASEFVRTLPRFSARGLLDLLDTPSLSTLISCAQRPEHAIDLLQLLSLENWNSLLNAAIRTDVRWARALVAHATPAQQQRLDEITDPTTHHLLSNLSGSVGDPRNPNWTVQDAVSAFRSAAGDRRSGVSNLGRWIRIDERLDTESGRERVQIDLLELDPLQVSLVCHLSSQQRPRLSECDHIFQGNVTEEQLQSTGLFRLTDEIVRQGAGAGINGNFYFDYGHYEYAKKLGIDCARFPEMRFGDPFGWFVSEGHEYCNPVLNRAAFIATEDGQLHIQRVKMQSLSVAGVTIRWDLENGQPEPSQTTVYTSIWGTDTPTLAQHSFYSIVSNTIVARRDGGTTGIPPTGFVLAVPREHRLRHLLDSEERVEIQNNFPKELGVVKSAMACGPLLVQDGELAVDFGVEEFGAKDSSVISFFLPRLYESYRAARSFVATLASGQVLLGVVTGRAYGAGRVGDSCGLTFGELAQLAQDLGAVHAMNLDGGGSSSLVCDTGQGMKPLNIPTGGNDVPRGSERFIANGWLVYRR